MPWPTDLNFVGMSASLWPHHISFQAALKGATTEPTQDFVADLATRQVDMVGL
jgi:hypothetical protein